MGNHCVLFPKSDGNSDNNQKESLERYDYQHPEDTCSASPNIPTILHKIGWKDNDSLVLGTMVSVNNYLITILNNLVNFSILNFVVSYVCNFSKFGSKWTDLTFLWVVLFVLSNTIRFYNDNIHNSCIGKCGFTSFCWSLPYKSLCNFKFQIITLLNKPDW